MTLPSTTAATSSSLTLLSVSDLSVAFDSTPILSDIRFDVAAGDRLVILGDSGCGKTTLLKSISGLLTPDRGTVLLEAVPVAEWPIKQRGIVYLDQEPLLFEHLNVFENIAFALRLKKQSAAEIDAAVRPLLAATGLESQALHRSDQLSGGQKQRVAFARAIIAKPRLLLLDEPFCSLDARTRATMQDLFRSLCQLHGISTVFVTHDVREALVVGTRFAFLSREGLQCFASRDAFIDSEQTGIPAERTFWRQLRSTE